MRPEDEEQPPAKPVKKAAKKPAAKKPPAKKSPAKKPSAKGSSNGASDRREASLAEQK
jgi:hypothetical protein